MRRRTPRRQLTAATALRLACERERCEHCGSHATVTKTQNGKVKRYCLWHVQ